MWGLVFFNSRNIFVYVFMCIYICVQINIWSQGHINVCIEIIINVPIKCTVFKWKVVQIALETVT